MKILNFYSRIFIIFLFVSILFSSSASAKVTEDPVDTSGTPTPENRSLILSP